MRTFRTNLPRLKHEKTEVERTTAFNNFTAELRSYATGYATAKEAILTDKDLSPAGQTKKIAQLNQAFAPTFNEFPQRLGRIKAQYKAEAEANYRPKPYQKGANELLEYMKGQEIRSYLNGLQPGDNVKHLLDPSLDPAGMYLHHVENSPIPIPWATSEIISRGHEARAQSLNPEGVLAVEDQEAFLETVAYNIGEVGKLLGIIPTDTTEDLPAE